MNTYVSKVLNEEIDIEATECNHHRHLGISICLCSHVIETLGKMDILHIHIPI